MSETAAPIGQTPADELGYEAARDELVRVVQALESGDTTLEQSLALWERGNALAERCEQWLQGARARLDAARGTEADAS
ncbi:exodeoxyribonuclease VII small subunit [Agrococcus jejuensis]|uniref:Exodeoxyribonuclease 7 small subunit n=1 Tax=Agrococcus jejuensis TaxID=399736 RepID=A0A1G8B6D1_9MICO|nr:Exodeoxyribonuclease VII small subunit [Agrococcus jejuensis]